LHKKTSKVVSCNVRGGANDDKTGEVTHAVQKIVGIAAIVGHLARGPKIDVKNVERAAKDGAVDSNTVAALEDPVSNVLAIGRPEEAEADAMKRFVDAHMASGRGSVVRIEDGAAKRGVDSNQHEQFLVVLDALEDNEVVIDNGDAFLTYIIAVAGVNVCNGKCLGCLVTEEK
jgi:hypothetical protein